MEWWAEFLTSTWTLAVVPTAIAISALIAFWKTVLEKRNVELDSKRLQIELEASSRRIVVPTAEEVAKYSFTQTFVRRTVRIGSMVLAVALPATLVLQNANLDQGPELPPPINIEQPSPQDPVGPAPPLPADPVPPPPRPPQPLRVGGQIKQPAKTKHVDPQYPRFAQSARVRGAVIIEVVIGPTGKVQDARVLRSMPLLDQAALDAVRQWEFTPTLLNNVPVPVLMVVTVEFTLQQEKEEKP